MIEQHEIRALLDAALEPLEWLASAVIDRAIESIPQGPVRSRVEEAVTIFRDKLRQLPEKVAAGAPYATREAAGEALARAVQDVLGAARDAVALCERIGDAIDARSSTTCH